VEAEEEGQEQRGEFGSLAEQVPTLLLECSVSYLPIHRFYY
jgi:hypothetical protein